MTVPAWQVFKAISDRLRKEREDYDAGRITKKELDRLQPWRGMYDKLFDTEKWDKMQRHKVRMDAKRARRS